MSLNIRLYQSCSLDIVRSLAFWGTCFLALECGPVTSSRQGGRKGRTWSSRLGVHWLSLLVSEAPKCPKHILTLFYLSKGFDLLFIFCKCVESSSLMTLLITNTSLLLCTTVISEGNGDKCLCSIRYLELTVKMSSYILWNHSILFPLFVHPPAEFSYIL